MPPNDDDHAPMVGLRLSLEAADRLKSLCAKHGFANALASPGGIDFYEGAAPDWLADFIAALGPSDIAGVEEGEAHGR